MYSVVLVVVCAITTVMKHLSKKQKNLQDAWYGAHTQKIRMYCITPTTLWNHCGCNIYSVKERYKWLCKCSTRPTNIKSRSVGSRWMRMCSTFRDLLSLHADNKNNAIKKKSKQPIVRVSLCDRWCQVRILIHCKMHRPCIDHAYNMHMFASCLFNTLWNAPQVTNTARKRQPMAVSLISWQWQWRSVKSMKQLRLQVSLPTACWQNCTNDSRAITNLDCPWWWTMKCSQLTDGWTWVK